MFQVKPFTKWYTFLELPSSITLKVNRFESQIA